MSCHATEAQIGGLLVGHALLGLTVGAIYTRPVGYPATRQCPTPPRSKPPRNHSGKRGRHDGGFIFATEALASSAAAATSSGNSTRALSNPARRASNSIITLSTIMNLSAQSIPGECTGADEPLPPNGPLREPDYTLPSRAGEGNREDAANTSMFHSLRSSET